MVVVCISREYKESPRCRLEFESICKSRKEVVPILLDPTYYPDGWLRNTLVSRSHHNFTMVNLVGEEGQKLESGEEDQYERVMGFLVSEVVSRGKLPYPQTYAPQFSLHHLATITQVGQWLDENGLGMYKEKFLLSNIDGGSLAGLALLLRHDATGGMGLLEKELGIRNVGHRLKFLSILRNLEL